MLASLDTTCSGVAWGVGGRGCFAVVVVVVVFAGGGGGAGGWGRWGGGGVCQLSPLRSLRLYRKVVHFLLTSLFRSLKNKNKKIARFIKNNKSSLFLLFLR